MKHLSRLLIGFLLSLGVCGTVHAEWTASGTVSNPSANQVLVQVTATADQLPSICAIGYAGVSASFRIQHRNAADNATIKEQYIGGALGTYQFCNQTTWLLQNGESVRIIMVSGVLGTVSVSLSHDIY